MIYHKNIRFYDNDIDKEKYDKFLMEKSDSFVFHTIEWKNVLEKTFNYKPFYIIATDNEDNKKSIDGYTRIFRDGSKKVFRFR